MKETGHYFINVQIYFSNNSQLTNSLYTIFPYFRKIMKIYDWSVCELWNCEQIIKAAPRMFNHLTFQYCRMDSLSTDDIQHLYLHMIRLKNMADRCTESNAADSNGADGASNTAVSGSRLQMSTSDLEVPGNHFNTNRIETTSPTSVSPGGSGLQTSTIDGRNR
jgi:hypothetical protein